MKKYLLPFLFLAVSCAKVEAPRYDNGIELSVTSLSLEGDESSASVVEVLCSHPWTAIADADWIRLSQSSSDASAKIIVSASANRSSGIRSATVSFSSQGKVRTLSVVQDVFRDKIEVSKVSTCLAAGKDRPFTLSIIANGSWSLTVPSCLTASATSGNGNADLTLTLNNSTARGDQKITLRCGTAVCEYIIPDVNRFSNTYLVTHGGNYAFAPFRCGGALVEGNRADWIFKTDAELFDDVVFDGSYVRFTVKEGKYGYGTIAMTDAQGAIQWSWMIWHTPELKSVTIGGNKWSDRNLGAWTGYVPAENQPAVPPSAMGAHFQWGRKDPFPGADVNAIYKSPSGYRDEEGSFFMLSIPCVFNEKFATHFLNDESSPFPIEYGIRNPWCFAHKSYPINDSVEKVLWTSTKGVHDPCPPGWKVPTADQLNSLRNTLYGSSFTKTEPYSNSYSKVFTNGSTVFFIPANGYLSYSRLNNSGRVATLWTSTWTSTDNMRRWYDNGTDITTGTDRMNKGFGVRCVAE